jgi:hypothetical protein
LLGFQLEFGLALVRDAFTEALHFWQEHRAERLRCAISTFMEELFPAIVEVVADNSLLLFGGGMGDNVQSVRLYSFGERRVSCRC